MLTAFSAWRNDLFILLNIYIFYLYKGNRDSPAISVAKCSAVNRKAALRFRKEGAKANFFENRKDLV